MENQRPKYTDAKEFALIRDMYFEKDLVKEKVDPIERLEREIIKQKNINKNSR